MANAYCPEYPDTEDFPHVVSSDEVLSGEDEGVSGEVLHQSVGKRTAIPVAEKTPQMAKPKRKRSAVSSLFVKFWLTLFVGIFLWTFVGEFHRVSGNAMYPSLRDGDLCIVYKLGQYVVGDVVYYTDEAGQDHFGRIAAGAGQTVSFSSEGEYQVNGANPAEDLPYVTHPSAEHSILYPCEVGDDEYFILNDFREDTKDSREMDVILKNQIKGRVLFQARRREF